MTDDRTQIIAAMAGDIFDTLRRIATATERIAAAEEAIAEMERQKIVKGYYNAPR